MSNWEDLRCFLAVAETGRLTAAARRLGVSQPTVGRRIKDLEAQLASKLLQRTNERYTLTTVGKGVYEYAQSIEKLVYDIERISGSENPESAGRVCVATTECIASAWLVKQVPDFAQAYPKIDLELVTGIGSAALLKKEADIALRVGERGSEALNAEQVGLVEFGLYASKAYLARRGDPTSLEDLSNHEVIESLRELTGLPQARRLREFSQTSEVAFSCDNTLTQWKGALNGLGIATLPRYLARGCDELQRVLVKDFSITRELWLVMHPDLLDTGCCRLVWDYLVDRLRVDSVVFGDF